MANLELIKKLNLKYNKRSPLATSTKSFSFNESFDLDNRSLNIQNSLRTLGNDYIKYFDEGKEAEVVLLFIDVCDFSTRLGHLNGLEISEYFNEYYNIVIPIIYEFGGEIDKIIGDGIICVFGEPFLNDNLDNCKIKADKCAKKIIASTWMNKFKSKIAFHFGKINYFKNKSPFYNELTMVGKPLTELFRLESISKNNRINYFVDFKTYPSFNWNCNINNSSSYWTLSDIEILPTGLKGIEYKFFQSNKYIFE